MKKMNFSKVRDCRLDRDSYFGKRMELVRESVIPYQWETLNDRVPDAAKSHCIENFRIAAGEAEGEFYGCVFQDSDLAKWLEAVAYSLMTKPDPELEATADEAIALIGRAQADDGYLNTYYTVKEPGKRWTNLRDNHELYCAGHMMEAAAAYYEATGKRELLDIMTRMAHHIDSVLGPEEGKLHGYPGHEEIELALAAMWRVTGDPVMLKLAKYFIDERGREPRFFDIEAERREGRKPEYRDPGYYAQWHAPVREQTSLEGHSVRALYLATGIAEVARETDDEELLEVCRRLYENLVGKRMYITGGVGSSVYGEAFTFDYDLPNGTAYSETCASIALCFFMRAMLGVDADSRYADTMETALYNTCSAGMSLDGKNFFYVNPLEVYPEASRKNAQYRHVLPVRPKWFGCACCPPNLARLLSGIGKYLFTIDGDTVYTQLYSAGEYDLSLSSLDITLKLKTDYPKSGEIRIIPSAGHYTLALRVPHFSAEKYSLNINGEPVTAKTCRGYLMLERTWSGDDTVMLTLDVSPRRVYANINVRDDAGKVAVARGPVVYCLEEADNETPLAGISLPQGSVFSEEYLPDKLGGIVELTANGTVAVDDGCDLLYRTTPPARRQTKLTFIPYYAWANRGEGEMTVFVREG